MNKLFPLFFVLLLGGCTDDFFGRTKLHRVSNVVEGNKLLLSSGIYVNLVGINPTDEGKEYLIKKFSGLSNPYVTLKRDSKLTGYPKGKGSEVFAYVKLTGETTSINKQLLMNCLSVINTIEAFDSLNDYSSIYKKCNSVETVIDENHTPKLPETAESMIEKVKKSVLFVINEQEESVGTAFIIKGGYGITNQHVLGNSSTWRLLNEQEIEFRLNKNDIIYADSEHDYVIFKLNETVPPLTIATNTPKQGAELFAIGNPQGLTFSVTKGTLSAYRNEDGQTFIQTDAAISGGNSGGPLVNTNGEVVGVVTSKLVKEGVENIGFAIDINWLLEDYKSK